MRADELSTFGHRLRQYREAAGLLQEELGERAGLTDQGIGALERGERRRPYPHTLQLLARALGLDDTARDALIAAVPRRGMSDPRPPMPTPPLRGPPFVGRREECAVLLARLADAWQGRGGVVMLLGEAGIGKTRLARELAEVAQAQGSAVLWGTCFEGDWQPPYAPWVEALRRYARARTPECLRRELGTGAGPISRLLPEIRALLPDTPVPGPLSPDEERYRLCDAVVQFLLAAAAERPVLAVVDDLHWADADPLRLMRHAARNVEGARVLLVGAYRDPDGLSDPNPLLATLASLHRETGYQRVPLRGLSQQEVATFLAQTAGQPLPEALVRAIEQETGGNPFYAGEVFRQLAEEAKLLWRDGRWSTDRGIGELGIPDGVRQVVAHRVARLPRQTGDLLRLASGLSGSFGFDVLAALSELAEDMLLDCLDEALQAGLIRSSDSVLPRYEFAHAIVRHLLYESFSKNPDRRARLHRKIAHALEQVYVGREAEGAAELAGQYYASAALPGASQGLRYALAAAEQARSAFAHDRVADLLHMAHDLARESPAEQRADILCRLAIAEAEAVRLEDARRTADEAMLTLEAASADCRARATFLVDVARALKDGGGDAALWEPLVERGLALVGDARDLLWARLTLLRDRFELLQSGPIGCVRWLGNDPEAVAIARAEGDEEDYARTLDSLECRTRAETELILGLARTWSTPRAVIRALDVAGRDLLYRHGAMREACEVVDELLAASERFGSIPGRAEALAQICTSRLFMGEFLLAREMHLRAEEAVGQLGAGYRQHGFFRISLALGLGYFLDGNWAPVAAELAAYATSPAAVRNTVGLVAAAYAALAASRAGDVTQARMLLEHVTALAERAGPNTYAQSAVVVAASAAVWELGEVRLAARYRRLVQDLQDAGAGDTVFGPLELLQARMASLLGDFDDAQDWFQRARRSVDAKRYGHLRAIVEYDQACALIYAAATQHTRIAGLLESAADGFTVHGMLGWLGRASEQRQKLDQTVARVPTESRTIPQA